MMAASGAKNTTGFHPNAISRWKICRFRSFDDLLSAFSGQVSFGGEGDPCDLGFPVELPGHLGPQRRSLGTSTSLGPEWNTGLLAFQVAGEAQLDVIWSCVFLFPPNLFQS